MPQNRIRRIRSKPENATFQSYKTFVELPKYALIVPSRYAKSAKRRSHSNQTEPTNPDRFTVGITQTPSNHTRGTQSVFEDKIIQTKNDDEVTQVKKSSIHTVKSEELDRARKRHCFVQHLVQDQNDFIVVPRPIERRFPTSFDLNRLTRKNYSSDNSSKAIQCTITGPKPPPIVKTTKAVLLKQKLLEKNKLPSNVKEKVPKPDPPCSEFIEKYLDGYVDVKVAEVSPKVRTGKKNCFNETVLNFDYDPDYNQSIDF